MHFLLFVYIDFDIKIYRLYIIKIMLMYKYSKRKLIDNKHPVSLSIYFQYKLIKQSALKVLQNYYMNK